MDPEHRWVLYGAYGYTGRLIVKEALERGHRPLLAGRRRERLEPVAEEAGLEFESVRIEELQRVLARLDPGGVLLNAAGPYTATARPALDACLEAGVHYLDVTGEAPVLESLYRRDSELRSKGITAVPAVGFHVVPADSLASRLHQAVGTAVRLELAFRGEGRPSAGTLKTMLEHLPRGALRRRGGVLIRGRVGEEGRDIPFADAPYHAIPATWGELASAYRTTEIRDIITYMAFSRARARQLRLAAPVLRRILSIPPLRRLSQGIGGLLMGDPDVEKRVGARAHVWGRVESPDGRSAWGRVETVEGYRFTAAASVRGVERLLGGVDTGALTPTQAFGVSFVEEVPETEVLGPFTRPEGRVG